MSRNFKISSLLSLTVPVALVLIPFTWLSSDTLDWSALPWLLGYWAFLSLPQLAIVLGAVIWASVRNHFATPALFLLTGLQIAYCCGIVWRVPWYESGSTWIGYFPVLVVMLVIVAVRARFVNHRYDGL